MLIVEDDPNLLEALRYNVRKEGHDVVTAVDGVQALEVARMNKPDLVILDIMLPGLSGFEVCRILRKEMTVPILVLTARDDEIDKVTGLDLGADDYMTKPFSMRELLARIRAMLRRVEIQTAIPEMPLKFGDIEVDTGHHVITKAGNVLSLTPKEFDLLAFLTKNKSLVFTRDQLLEKVWGYNYSGDTRTVDVHIRWLREKIEDNPEEPKCLITIRGVGYKFGG
ncbi:MAG: response regulator transcription factor [Dehalococcoidales bacterium]|nr:response regulator transcription factor [Dehalococcoidales bacterium]